MADYNVKLKVDTSQHDRAMQKSAGQVNNFSKRILDAKDKVAGLASKVPALALAVGGATLAFKGFMKVMNSTDSGADALGGRMEQLKSVTDGFLMSIQMGNFSGFIAGIDRITASAKDAYDAMDALGTHLITSTFAHSVSESKLSRYKEIITDETKTTEERQQAKNELQAEYEKAKKLYNADISKYHNAALNMFKSMTNGMGSDAQFKEFSSLLEGGMEWQDAANIFVNRYEKQAKTKTQKNYYKKFIAGFERLREKADSDQMQEFVNTLTSLYRSSKEQTDLGRLINRYMKRNIESKADKGGGITVPVTIETNAPEVEEELVPVIGSLTDLEQKLAAVEEEIKMTVLLDDVEQTHELLLQVKDLEDQINNKKVELGMKAPEINIAAGPTSDAEAYNTAMSNAAQLQESLSGSFDTVFSSVTNATGAINGLGSALGEAFGSEGVSEFFNTLQNGLNVLNSVYQAYQAITGVIEVVNTLKTTSIALSEAQAAADAAATATSLTKTSADSGAAIAGATKAGASIPFPWNLVAIAAGIAAVVGALSLIGKFADGGIVGGNSMVGDKMIARVNSGEMILNKRQQANLFNMLNGTGHSTSSTTEGNVKFRISGTDLVGILSNQSKKASRVL